MDCRMQRELVDIVLEAVSEIADLPETLVNALVEGAHALTGGTRNFRPLTDEETNAVIAYMKANSERIGVQFDENWYRTDIARHPGKYQVTLSNIRKRREMPTAADRGIREQQMKDRKNLEETNRATRFKYYVALLPRIKKAFAYNNIPFDETTAMKEIIADDTRWLGKSWLKDAQENPAFASLGIAMKDPAASFLRRKNPALGKLIQDAFNFAKMGERELEQKKTEYRYMRPDVSMAAENPPKIDGESTTNADFNNLIAPWFGKDTTIGEIISKCKGVPYDYICRYFVEHGAADRIKDAPKPGEDIIDFLNRLPRGTGSEMEFTSELNKIADAAYGKAAVDNAVKAISSRQPDEYAAMSEKCSRSMVKPKDIPLYAAWSTLHVK